MSSLSNFSPPRHVRIAVVGDVHEAWDGDDPQILQKLGIDLVLFVGDFGNESVATVQSVAQMPLPKAVVLGNHDAWYTASPWGRKKSPYDHRMEDRVQQQLDLLGNTHVGYGKLDFPQLGFTVVGSRPFSWGDKNGRMNSSMVNAMEFIPFRNPLIAFQPSYTLPPMKPSSF